MNLPLLKKLLKNKLFKIECYRLFIEAVTSILVVIMQIPKLNHHMFLITSIFVIYNKFEQNKKTKKIS